MDIDKELRKAERTGKVVLGSKEALKSMKNGKSRLILITPNCAESIKNKINQNSKVNEIPIYNYNGTSEDLGLAFGKPFLVSVATIINPGNSQILDLGGKIIES